MAASQPEIATETAQLLAVDGLAFIVNDHHALTRFMALSGLSADDIRSAAGEPEFLAGVLSFLMDHEAVLLAFAATSGFSPQEIAGAHLALSGTPVWDS